MIQRLPLTLDELYTGVKKDFAVNRNKICPDCKGFVLYSIIIPRVGSTKPNAVHRCPRCNGKGFIMQSEKYSRDNAGQSLKKYMVEKVVA